MTLMSSAEEGGKKPPLSFFSRLHVFEERKKSSQPVSIEF